MFKLLKITDSGASAPEIITINATNSMECRANHVYTVKGGTLHAPLHNDGFLFVPIEDLPMESEIEKIRGYLVSPNMLFETSFVGPATNTYAGDNVSASVDDSGIATGITNEPGTFATIIDMSTQKQNGRVIIRINA